MPKRGTIKKDIQTSNFFPRNFIFNPAISTIDLSKSSEIKSKSISPKKPNYNIPVKKGNRKKYIIIFIIVLIVIGISVGLFFLFKPKEEEQRFDKTEETLLKYAILEFENEDDDTKKEKLQNTDIIIDTDYVNELWNNILNLTPENYKQHFSKCDALNLESITSNIVCFKIDYEKDQGYNKDILAAIILNYYLLAAILRKKVTKNENIHIVYIKNKKIVSPVNSVIVPLGEEKRMSLKNFVDHLIKSITNLGLHKCQYCV